MTPLLCLLPLVLLLLPATTPGIAGAPLTLSGKRLSKTVIYYEMHVTVATGAPDCYARDVVLCSGLFQPTIEVNVNDTLMVNVFNEIPSNFPQVASGISIHWHGLYMWGKAAWYDGTSYGTQCPIAPGKNYTYKFQVNEAPGTYMWHDHSTANRANGLQGALIVLQNNQSIHTPWPTEGEHMVLLSDWFHDEGNVMAMRLNRPAIVDKGNANTGYYEGVPNPDSLLINGKGFYGDCGNTTAGASRGANGYVVPLCQPQLYPVDNPISDVGASTGGCGHAVFDVVPGSTYYFRLLNAASASYITLCFENHTVSMIGADAIPVDEADYECIDINSGQRYDVLLKADLATPPGTSFWISAHSQFRNLAPSTYAILQYVPGKAGSTPASPPSSSTKKSPPHPPPKHNSPPYSPPSTPSRPQQWPSSPPPQPGIAPWQVTDQLQINTHAGVLGYLDNYVFQPFWQQYSQVGGQSYFNGVLYYDANQTIVMNMTSPTMNDTGMVRWAIDNVAMPNSPPCTPLMQDVIQDPEWVSKHAINTSSMEALQAADSAAANLTQQVTGEETVPSLYVDGQPAPMIPIIGKHVAEIKMGTIVDIVVNNRPANEGNPGSTGSAMMLQHPLHMHGHKFWLLGIGSGVYNATTDSYGLNTYNPLYRDTFTLPVGSWAVIRVFANNPGLWPFHCHIFWHSFVGQQMFILEAQDLWPAPPKVMPACSAKCRSTFALYTESFINETYGPVSTNPHQLP